MKSSMVHKREGFADLNGAIHATERMAVLSNVDIAFHRLHLRLSGATILPRVDGGGGSSSILMEGFCRMKEDEAVQLVRALTDEIKTREAPKPKEIHG